MRDKLINKMAEGDNNIVDVCRAYESKCGSVYEIVETVLDALLGELEEVEVYPSCPVSNCDITSAKELYQQLLDMRK